jgi:hypothetical protein
MDQDAFVTCRENGVEDNVELAAVSRQPSGKSSKSPTASFCSIPFALETVPQIDVDCLPTTLRKSSPSSRTRKQEIAERFQLCACFWFAFIVGWNDGSTGPLLPRIQEVYNACLWFLPSTKLLSLTEYPLQIGFTVVSMIFVCTTVVSARSNRVVYLLGWT